MKLCFPVPTNEGVESSVYGHFGSAPLFLLVDTETQAVSIIVNSDQAHAQGACNPLRALAGNPIDAVIVGGIGRGALNKLNQAGIKVYRAGAKTIKENVSAHASGSLQEFVPEACCGGHGHGGSCAH